MKYATLILVAGITLVSACPRAGAGDVTKDDTPDLGDLIQPDGDAAAAAAQVGDPATLLAMAIDQAEHVRGDVFGILKFLHDATDRDPDAHGKNVLDQPFGRWDVTADNGNAVHVIAIRTAEDRVRIIVQGENADGLSLPLLTGVFVKKGPRVGGGKFHLSFTNYSDLFAAPGQGADGSIHFLFANNRADLRGRRVLYLNVDDRATPAADPKSFAADLVRLPGVGGRFRSIYAADMNAQFDGLEAVGLRTAWLAGVGGRTDVVIATQAGGGQVLAVASECYDAGGLRTAYKDTIPDNDAVDPDAGDVNNCHDIQSEPADQGTVQTGGQDDDTDLDAALTDGGADDVTDDEAADDSVPGDAADPAQAP